MTSTERRGVCQWCGTSFVAPRRGRIPTYCKTSHRIRAYERRKMAAALAEAEGRASPSAAGDLAWAREPPAVVRVPTPDHSAAVQELQTVVARAAAVTVTKPNELRASIEGLAEAIRRVMAARGLPEIDPADAASWWLVVPVSQALREAEATLAGSPRSARALHAGQGNLLAAAAALCDPEAHTDGSRTWASAAHLAIAVPGPDGALPTGIFETDHVGRYKSVFWAPGAHAFRGEALAKVAGRPEGFRYRWNDRRVWEQLAHDMIVVSCGWQTHPEWIPPALGGPARAALGRQLRQDLGATSDWALDADTIVRWLERNGYVSVIPAVDNRSS